MAALLDTQLVNSRSLCLWRRWWKIMWSSVPPKGLCGAHTCSLLMSPGQGLVAHFININILIESLPKLFQNIGLNIFAIKPQCLIHTAVPKWTYTAMCQCQLMVLDLYGPSLKQTPRIICLMVGSGQVGSGSDFWGLQYTQNRQDQM